MANDRNFEGEVTKAIGHSLDFHKIIVMAVAIAIATIAFHLFGWIGSKISGDYVQLFRYLISGIGWLVGAIVVLSAMVAVCKMASAKDGGQKVGFVGGIGHSVAAVFTVFFACFKYLIWLAAGIIVTWVLGWVGLIPKAGPIIWGIAGFIAVLVGLYLAFFVVGKFFLSTLVLPGIIAEGGGKAIRYFNESKRIMNGHTVRLIKRFLSIGLVVVIFVFVTMQAWAFIASKTADTMAGNTRQAITGGPPMTVAPVVPSYQQLPIIGAAANIGNTLGGGKGAGAWIFGIEMIIILLVIQSIPTIFFAVAGMYTYQTLKGEAETPITSPDIGDLGSKIKGSFDGLGAKFKEEMKDEAPAKKPAKKEKES